MKTAQDILNDISLLQTHGDLSIQVVGLSIDSREVESDWAFFAYKGYSADGHQYIPAAIAHGASLIICEELPEEILDHITYVKVEDCKKAIGIAAANFYDHPSNSIELVGITGTNGKTTVATLCYQLFKDMGYQVGLLSTIQNLIDEEVYPSTHTTSNAININKMLREMVDKGCQYAFMEVSSHAIDQDRIYGLEFIGGVFTNITHDHLDYHETFSNYIYAKKKFFDHLPKDAFALVNIDDKRGQVMLQNCGAQHYTFALKNIADFHAKILESNFNGLALHINNTEVYTRLIGQFNAYNILSVYGVATLLGEDSFEILRVLSTLTGAQGRFEWIKSKNEGVIGIVDYAHTPDALKNVLDTVNDVKMGTERLITIFGCGGDRDHGKRPKMGHIAAESSDIIIITSDNPRSEEPMSIIQEIKQGVPIHLQKNTFVQVDRKEAIRMAVSLTQKNDIIMIAGKGHEEYQEIKGEKHPFNDKAILQETFKEMNK